MSDKQRKIYRVAAFINKRVGFCCTGRWLRSLSWTSAAQSFAQSGTRIAIFKMESAKLLMWAFGGVIDSSSERVE